MKIFQSFFILLFFCACSSNEETFNEQKRSNFPPAVELEGTRVFEDEIGLMYIEKIDSLLVLSTMNAPFIRVYDENHKFIADFGKKGKGPGEFSMPPLIRQGIQSESATKIFAYDQQALNRIDLRTSIDSNKVIIEKKYELPRELTGTIDVFYVDSTGLAGIYDDRFSKQLNEQRGGFYYSTKTEQFEIFRLFNLEVNPYEVMPATNLNARVTAISPDRNKLASVMAHYPALEVVDIDSSTFDRSRYLLAENPPERTFKLETFKEGNFTIYYKFINASSDYIYLLYAGVKDKNSEKLAETHIQVMDWNGNGIREFKVPAKYSLDMFIVDEANQCFYGLDYTVNDAIYRFDYGSVK